MKPFNVARGAAIAGMCLIAGSATGAAQMPVIDGGAILKQVEQIIAMEKQLTTLKDQLGQQQQLFGSLNKLTNMGDIASLLNDSKIRSALGTDFAAVKSALTGSGAGTIAANAQAYQQENEVYARPGDDFYAQESRRAQQANAGQAGVAQQMYEAASRRMAGLDQLRQQIGRSEDPKSTLDLQARISAESAFLQNDIVKMQSLAMLQNVEAQTREQRAREDYDKRIDQNTRAFGGTVPSGGTAGQ